MPASKPEQPDNRFSMGKKCRVCGKPILNTFQVPTCQSCRAEELTRRKPEHPARRVDVEILKCSDCGRLIVAIDGVRVYSHKCSGSWEGIALEHVSVARITELPAFRAAYSDRDRRVVEALKNAILQIEYLHERFQATGSGNSAIEKVRAALAEMEQGL